MAYEIYFNKILFPVAPSKIITAIKNQNKTVTLIDTTEINVINKSGLSTFEFTLMLPSSLYPFAKYKKEFKPPSYFLEKLEKIKNKKRPFTFIIYRGIGEDGRLHETNILATLEDYKIEENASNGTDINVNIKLKKYNTYHTYNKVLKNKKVKRKARSKEGRKIPAIYKVKKRDTIMKISKKIYGDTIYAGKLIRLNNLKTGVDALKGVKELKLFKL